ncbi:MAG TPA: sigma-70 family RNA polymerase sigma factor [Patescibacteria group bacterium]|nr:sigma-70 family RNA polymerase sigma factor [Patescibacteria group bacterium]
MQDFSDAELISKYLQQGESEALEELVRRYFKQVYFFAKGYVKQDQEAEDLTQEAFVKAWKNLKKFDSKKKFKTWLFQITKNTCIDYLRKHKNLLAADALQEEQMAATLEQMEDTQPLPEELFDQQGFEQRLDEILQDLPANYRQITSLHLQQDLTFQEISNLLDKPLNTIKSNYRRALIRIRQSLKGGDG